MGLGLQGFVSASHIVHIKPFSTQNIERKLRQKDALLGRKWDSVFKKHGHTMVAIFYKAKSKPLGER